MTKERLKELYEAIFGQIKEELGYSYTIKKVKSGWLFFHWYERNSWVDDKLERKVLFSNGNIYENNVKVGSY